MTQRSFLTRMINKAAGAGFVLRCGLRDFVARCAWSGRPSALSGAALAILLLAGPGLALSQAAADKPLAELLTQKRWPEALAAIDQALKARPNDTQLLMNRGAVLSNLNRDGEALRVFQAVATANPKWPAAHNNMAVILAAMGRYDEARAALQRAIKAQPGYATAHENLGDLYAHQAAEAYRKALEIDPSLKAAKSKLNLTADIITLATGVRPAGPALAAQPPAVAAAAALAGPASAPVARAPSASAVSAPAAAPAAAPKPAPPAPGSANPAPAAASAPAPATVVPPKTASESAKPPAATPSSAEAEVEAAVRAWALAWTRRDAARYVAAYADDYRGGTDTPAIWRELAQKRLRERSSIRVDLTQLAVSVDGESARARFEQAYESDQPGSRMRTRKTLVLQKVKDRWLIREEIRN